MRYYHFDINGKYKADFAVPQEGIETQLLPERTSEYHDEWDGKKWILNKEVEKTAKQNQLEEEMAESKAKIDAYTKMIADGVGGNVADKKSEAEAKYAKDKQEHGLLI